LPFFQGKADFGDLYPSVRSWCSEPQKIAEKNDILISVRAPVGPTNLCTEKSCIGRGLSAIRCGKDVHYKFVLYAIRHLERTLSDQGRGSTFASITQKELRELEIPVPPLSEQRLIVSKLDAVLGVVASCRERLAKISTLLKRFRQPVLANACNGKLTEEWRTENGICDDQWQEQTLKELLSEPLANGRSVRDGIDGVPVLRLTCLKKGRIDLSERKIGDWSKSEAEKFFVKKGDFFVSRGNGSHSLVGRGGLLIDEPNEIAFPDTLIRIRVCRKRVLSEFLATVWNSASIRQQIEAVAHTSAGIWKISQGNIEELLLSVPPLSEQREIVRRVESLFAFADRIESRLSSAAANVEKLTQSVLAKAFRGELG
jgi:type I restriction enzyme S subunit